MATCKECLHNEMCYATHTDDSPACCDFKDRSKYVVREKGEWIEDGYYGNPFVCSYCGHEGCYSGNYDDKDYYPTNFCPNCGADMRAEEQNRAKDGENDGR